jgi:hypothetical protein
VLNKYLYYEAAVQGPKEHVFIFNEMYRRFRKREPLVLREDFSGTFRISSEWVKSGPKKKAIAIDLDAEPLQHGLDQVKHELNKSQHKRLTVLQKNVIKAGKTAADIISVCNFSFFTIHDRTVLKKYFQQARLGLRDQGIFILEMAGGPGFIQTTREHKWCKAKGLGRFRYTWDQKSFDPITRNGKYAIHFTLESGKRLKDVFTYDWRIWSIPEIKDLMKECGFNEVFIYWETSNRHGNGTGEYMPAESGDNAYAWIAFVIGLK